MKKVLFIVTALDVGGLETYLLRFLQFSSKTLDVNVLCKSGREGILDEDYKQQGSDIILLKLGYFSFINYLKLYNYLKDEKPETVCDFTGDFSGIVMFVSRIAKIQNRLVFYRSAEYSFKPSLFKMIYVKIMNFFVKIFSTKILSNSEAALNRFHFSWRSNLHHYDVIYNGVPLFNKISKEAQEMKKSELLIPENAFIIGHMGRFHQQKNHNQILKVASILISKYDNVFFFLCGKDVKDSLGDSVKELGLEHRIILDNARNDVWELLQCFDAFYFPSFHEGNPNALLEAMSVGLPFVASDIDEIKEAVYEKYHNCLIPPNNIDRAVKLFSDYIDNKSDFSSKALSKWTQNNYNAEKLFNKFYLNL